MTKIIGFEKSFIISRAKTKWNEKTGKERQKASSKYNFLFDKLKKKKHSWLDNFDDLDSFQKGILIKGELIRTYDGLPNITKTIIMREFGLSSFSSKWYKLNSNDKKILFDYVIS